MVLGIIFYIFGFVCFFVWFCYDEIKNFFGDNKHELILGFVASFFWPICLIVMLGDFLEDFFARIVSRRSRSP